MGRFWRAAPSTASRQPSCGAGRTHMFRRGPRHSRDSRVLAAEQPNATSGVDIEPEHLEVSNELDRERQADVAHADDPDTLGAKSDPLEELISRSLCEYRPGWVRR